MEANRPTSHAPLPGLIGDAPPMQQLARLVRRCARLRMPVLLRGESGTGKDLVARAIHAVGQGPATPYVPINGATLRSDLAGSELFGHLRGAFTGAVRERLGAFQRANRGTLFLDEVAALPLAVQAALLRVVEDGLVTPVGSDTPRAVTVRLVAATCEPLEEHVRAGRFRADLYQRLASCVVEVPPLRRRLADLPALAEHLLATSELGPHRLDEAAYEALRAHRWPGNVRELRNVLVQAALEADGQRIGLAEVAQVLASRRTSYRRRLTPEQARQLLAQAGGNVSKAARRARMARTTFRDLARAGGDAGPCRPGVLRTCR
ncbi:MAG: sigma-54-dependent Fis family transcriptional regulator [Deltaproteobacteria bacterium]|nr:sigma-54-dependent Fis family transcriptional regulator [Deltaproteobacteria bacterium]MBW2532456.1 sigma-54-dependent Fis family transcriptional regulator [Deltaproteobacteria bacterium]